MTRILKKIKSLSMYGERFYPPLGIMTKKSDKIYPFSVKMFGGKKYTKDICIYLLAMYNIISSPEQKVSY